MVSAVYFGTKSNMQWIPCPAVDVGATKQGYGATAAFLGGGVWVRRSKVQAKHYTMSWMRKSREVLRPISDYADGVYGNGFIYYLDPFALDTNILPSYIAQPAQNYYDGPWIADGVRPTLDVDPTSVNGYPVESGVYTITSTSSVPSYYIPIPPGHTFGVGVHGALVSGSARVTVTPQTSPISTGTTVDIPTFSINPTSNRITHTFAADDGMIGVNISMSSASSGVLQLQGIVGQIRPDGQAFPTGPFISGQGSSGLQFAPGSPTYSQYSIALDQVGVTAELIETEAWTWQ